jgi:hypothetical protein
MVLEDSLKTTQKAMAEESHTSNQCKIVIQQTLLSEMVTTRQSNPQQAD